MTFRFGLRPDERNRLKTWKPATADVRPDSNHVDVWRIPTRLDPSTLAYFESALSPQQRDRAARLRVNEKRHQYVIAHGLTRRILARAISISPERIEFTRGPKGKPYLGGSAADTGIHFNMTHTSHMALIAVSRGREVGIDIERIRRNLQWEKLARRYFSPREYSAFRVQPPDTRLRAFFVCWTRKEAVLKAIGTGIGGGLASFDVSVDPDSPPRLLGNRWNGRFHGDWSMVNLEPDPHYAGTLVTEFGGIAPRLWDVDPNAPI